MTTSGIKPATTSLVVQ